jgi:hypothetical protein
MNILEKLHEAERKARDEYRWIESEKAGLDLGHNAELEWDRKYMPDFRRSYIDNLYALEIDCFVNRDFDRARELCDELRVLTREYCGKPFVKKEYP